MPNIEDIKNSPEERDSYGNDRRFGHRYGSEWVVADLNESLERVKKEEECNDLKTYIWRENLLKYYLDLKIAKEHELRTDLTDEEKKEIKQQALGTVKSEMERGWPSYANGSTQDATLFMLMYSEGDRGVYDHLKDIKWFLPEGLMVISRNSIGKEALSNLYEFCSQDQNKVLLILTAIDLKILKIEDVKEGLDFESILQKVKSINPEYKDKSED
jgi:hypothetical protein